MAYSILSSHILPALDSGAKIVKAAYIGPGGIQNYGNALQPIPEYNEWTYCVFIPNNSTTSASAMLLSDPTLYSNSCVWFKYRTVTDHFPYVIYKLNGGVRGLWVENYSSASETAIQIVFVK